MWTSFECRSPPKNESVLVTDGEAMSVDVPCLDKVQDDRGGEAQGWFAWFGDKYKLISHWQPLPDLPAQEMPVKPLREMPSMMEALDRSLTMLDALEDSLRPLMEGEKPLAKENNNFFFRKKIYEDEEVYLKSSKTYKQNPVKRIDLGHIVHDLHKALLSAFDWDSNETLSGSDLDEAFEIAYNIIFNSLAKKFR